MYVQSHDFQPIIARLFIMGGTRVQFSVDTVSLPGHRALAPPTAAAPITMSLNPIIALDHVIEEYRDHLQSEFRASDRAPRLCLTAFDGLQSTDLEAFSKEQDLYWDLPLNDDLPQPVIDLSIPAAAPEVPPAKSHRELLNFQTAPASAGSGAIHGAASGKATTKTQEKLTQDGDHKPF